MLFQAKPLALRRLLAGLILASVSATAGASTNSVWAIRVWQSDDGLPNNTVNGLAQTSDGYIYLATQTRLARFDGVSFEELPFRDFSGSFNHKIRTLLTDHNGGLCLAMDEGLAVLDPGNSQLLTNGLEGVIPQYLVQDGAGAFWIVYNKNKVCRVKDGRVKHFGPADGLDNNATCTLAADKQGRLWFGQGRNVGMFNNKEFETLIRVPGTTTRVAAARDGGIWIYSNGQLLKYKEGGEMEDRGHLNIDPPYRTPTVFLESRDGAVWIGTSDHGLFRYDGAGFEVVPTSHSDVLDVLEDHEGNLWIGTDGGGLNRFNPRAIELVQGDPEVPFEAINSVCEDAQETLWVVTQTGVLARRTASGWRNLSNEKAWPGGGATCVAAASDGGVWIGTGHGLRRWHEGTFETWLPSTHGLAGRVIRALLVSRNGDLWIGEQGPYALQCLHEGEFRTIALPAGANLIRAMTEDLNGDIWIGTANGMVLCVSNNVALDRTAMTLSEPKSIRCLLATADGSLWFGYAGSGVGRLKNGQFLRVRADEGLYDNSISEILSDDHGWLWFGADHGIFKVRRQDFDALAEHPGNRIHSVHYGRNDGAPSLQAEAGDWPNSLCSRDGRLWMAMRNGLAAVKPGELREDSESPPVLLKRVLMDDHTVAVYGGVIPVHGAADLQQPSVLKIPPGYRRLEFQFAALSYRAPENVRFRYRLEGFDSAWVEPGGDQRVVTYSRLPAGHYQFELKACNGDGVWNEVGTRLAFVVTPFWWQTWWFRLTAAALFAFGVGIAVRYVSVRRLRLRVQALERQAALDRERARIARDIHDDLGASLTQMTLLTGLTLRGDSAPEQINTHLRQLSSTVRQVTDSLDEIVWAVNPRNDTLPHMVNYLGKFALGFLRTAGVRCSVDLPERPPPHPLSAEARHNLFLVAKEALNNSVRHAHATEIGLAVTLADGALKITVQDNGRGLDSATDEEGADGLRNMRERMESIGGRFDVESRPGAGTRIVMVYPCLNGKMERSESPDP